MPTPDYQAMDYDPLEPPHTGIEIIGRGAKSRKSKTFIPTLELADITGNIANHGRTLMELFRACHARENKALVEVKDQDGKKTLVLRPEVLSNDQIRARYPVVAEWEEEHQEAVEHYASIKGFSVVRTTGHERDAPRERSQESSAGTDRRPQANGAEKPRWQ